MSRLMSVAYTEQAVRDRTKTVTRRKGWLFAKPGDRYTLCRKVMGRKPGEPLVRICDVEVVSVRREPLASVAQPGELAREGFPDLTPEEFMGRYFTTAQRIDPWEYVTRIEWRYLAALAAAVLALSACTPTTVARKDAAPSTAVVPSAVESTSPEPVTPPPEVTTGTIGTTFTITGEEGQGEITLTKARDVKPSEFDEAAGNGRYLEVTVEAIATDGVFSIDPLNFAAVDLDGTEYEQTYCCAGHAGHDLIARDLHTGQRAKGVILFDARKGRIDIAYRDLFDGEDLGIWALR